MTRARTCIGGICSRATSEDLIETAVFNEGDCKFFLIRLEIRDRKSRLSSNKGTIPNRLSSTSSSLSFLKGIHSLPF